MKRLERLDYLKNVKREEATELIKKARALDLPLDENEEFDKAKSYQAEIEIEISELESISDKEYPTYLKNKQIKQVVNELKQDKFLKFIDNDAFLFTNRSKKFTREEKVAIIVHSTNQSLESKFEALNEILSKSRDKSLNKKIRLWIDYKQKLIEKVKSIDNGEEVFVVCNKIKNLYDTISPRAYRRLDDSLQYCSEKRIDILKIVDQLENKSPRNQIVLTNNYKISDISYSGIEHEYKNLPREEKLEYIKVGLKNPFKPFTVISCCVYGGLAIVADIRDERVKKQVEQSKQYGRRDGWLNCEIPIYMFSNGWMSGADAHLQAGCLYGEYDDLSDIREVEMTLGQKEYITYLKKAVKENK